MEHGEAERFACVASIAQLHDLAQVLALEPAKISAYGLSASAPAMRRGASHVRILQSIDHLTPAQALSAYDVGLSILCGDLLPLLPELDEQVAGLLGEFGLPARGSGANRLLDLTGVEPIEAMMSFSPPGAAAALGLHYDAFDVIGIQLRGTKVWMLGANEEIEFPLSSFETETPFGITPAQAASASSRSSPHASALERIELRPGSALFVPRGVWHSTQEVGEDEASVTLLLKMSPPSYVEVLISALFEQLSERPQWRAPCVGLFRPGALRKDAVRTFEHLTAGLHLNPEDLLLRHYMPQRSPPELFVFRRTEGATSRLETAADGAALWRLNTPAGAHEIEVDASLLPLCRWIAGAGGHVLTFAEACAHAGGADGQSVWSLMAALEDAGWLAAAIEPPAAAPRAAGHAPKR